MTSFNYFTLLALREWIW